jgi:cytochrome P450
MHHLLYRSEEGLPSRLAFGGGMQVLAVADPPIHTLHRSVVFPELVGRRMAALDGEIRDLAVRCVGRALDDRNVDFMAYVGNVVPITMILGLIAERPGLQERLRQDPDLIPSFVEEALRLESPFRFLLRHTSASTELGGVDIPADTTVLLFWGAANRDSAQYERPDEVVLDRKAPRHHLAFGRGIHYCVGAPLARLEAQVVLEVLLEETSNVTIDPEQSPRWFDSLQVRRHEYLPVQLVPR